MSSSFGGGGRGDIRYVISVDDSQAIQKLQGVGQQLQQMGQTGQQATQGLQQLPQTLDQTAQAGDKVTQSQQQMSGSVQQSTGAVKQQEQAQQSFGSVVKQNIQAIVQIGSGIVGLVANYYSLQRVQLQINKLEVTEANQRRMLGVLTRQHAAAVEEYGANSQEAHDIENKINILQAKHTNTLDQLQIRQEQANLGMINFGLSIVQTGSGLIQAAGQIKTFTGGIQGADKATKALTASQKLFNIQMSTGNKAMLIITAVLLGLEAAAQAVAHNFMGFRDWLDQAYNSLVKWAPALKPVIDAVWTLGKFLTAIFTGDWDAAKSVFGMTAEAATDMAGSIDDVTESGKNAQQVLEDHKQVMEEINLAYGQFGAEKAAEKWKDLRKELDEMGFGKGARKAIKIGLKWTVEKPQQAISDLIEGLDFVNLFHLKPSTQASMVDNVIDDIKKAIKKTKGQGILPKDVSPLDFMKPFLKVLEEHKKDPELPKVLSELVSHMSDEEKKAFEKYVGMTPEEFIKHMGFDPISLEDAKTKAVANAKTALEKTGHAVQDTMSQMDWKKIMEIPYNALSNYEEVKVPGSKGKHFKHKDTEGSGITKMLENIKTQITNYNWKGVGESVVKGIFALPSNLSTTLKTFVDPITNQILVFLLQDGPLMVSEFIAKTFTWANVKTALTSITTLASDIVTQLFGFMSDPKTTLEGIKTFALNALNGIADWMKKSMPETAKTLEEVGGMIIDAVYKGLIATVAFGAETIAWIASVIKENVTAENLLKAGQFIAGALMVGIKQLVKFGTNVISWVSEKIVAAVSGMLSAGTAIAGQIWQGIVDFFTGKTNQNWKDAITGNILPPEIDNNNQRGGTKTQSGYLPGYGYSSVFFGAGGTELPGMGGGGIVDSWSGSNGTRYYDPGYGRHGGSGTDFRILNQGYSTGGVQPRGTIDPYTGHFIGSYGAGGGGGGSALSDSTKSMEDLTKANPMDIFARQLVQVTKDLSVFARALVTVTKDNNVFAKTIVTITKDLNQIARAVVTTVKDLNQLARAVVTNVKDNNQFAKTIVTVTKDFNQMARAIVTTVKDYNQLARATVQNTKNNNTLARTIVQVGKDFNSAASDAKTFASALNGVASAAKSAASAIRSIPKPPSSVSSFASGGDFITQGPELIMVGDNPGGKERVKITPLSGSPAGRYINYGQELQPPTVNQTINLQISGTDIINPQALSKRIKLTVGENRDRFG